MSGDCTLIITARARKELLDAKAAYDRARAEWRADPDSERLQHNYGVAITQLADVALVLAERIEKEAPAPGVAKNLN